MFANLCVKFCSGFKLIFLTALTLAALNPQGARADSISARILDSVFSPRIATNQELSGFPKWTRVASGYNVQKHLSLATCAGDNVMLCNSEKWKTLLNNQAGQDWKNVFNNVNRFINQFPYIEDANNYGMDDYWATPQELFARGGDCEDFAIAKYMALKALGFPTANMRILVLNDHNLDILHAVLVVKYGKATYVLDNQVPEVMMAGAIRHYEPIFSINEQGWWKHQITTAQLVK